MTAIELFSIVAMIAGVGAVICMILLHILSPEFSPSWRMISEYAYGKNKGLLTSFFMLWGISTISSALFIFQITPGFWASFGAILVIISGLGAIMGGLFDIRHKLHGLSFMLGVPTLPAGALLVSYQLKNIPPFTDIISTRIWAAHSTWLSVILMGILMVSMMQSFKKAGVEMGPDQEPPKNLPPGVKAYAGYANRLLVFCYILWSVLIVQF